VVSVPFPGGKSAWVDALGGVTLVVIADGVREVAPLDGVTACDVSCEKTGQGTPSLIQGGFERSHWQQNPARRCADQGAVQAAC
jgi:hypothetical protein